ncbi:hypothetical protein NliqN6_3459 [Naganishia liquefaciens]|uniref:Uncharacterized protein n=1 Tax=Naganishia liquefaciens TaxID=104408 RepID=A0A8H3YGB2_9TREE|nr:hypothetical protein NliqN6_3459 [Naganishia liquefaciens]
MIGAKTLLSDRRIEEDGWDLCSVEGGNGLALVHVPGDGQETITTLQHSSEASLASQKTGKEGRRQYSTGDDATVETATSAPASPSGRTSTSDDTFSAPESPSVTTEKTPSAPVSPPRQDENSSTPASPSRHESHGSSFTSLSEKSDRKPRDVFIASQTNNYFSGGLDPTTYISELSGGGTTIFSVNGVVQYPESSGSSAFSFGPGVTVCGPGLTVFGDGSYTSSNFQPYAQQSSKAKQLPDLGNGTLKSWELNNQKQTIGKTRALLEIEGDVKVLDKSDAKALGSVVVGGALHVEGYSKLEIPEGCNVDGDVHLDEVAHLKANYIQIEKSLTLEGSSMAEIMEALIDKDVTLSIGSQVKTFAAKINGSLVMSGGSQFCATATVINGGITMRGGSQISFNGSGGLIIGGEVRISGGSQLDLSRMKANQVYKLQLTASGGSQITVKKGIVLGQTSHWKLTGGSKILEKE